MPVPIGPVAGYHYLVSSLLRGAKSFVYQATNSEVSSTPYFAPTSAYSQASVAGIM